MQPPSPSYAATVAHRLTTLLLAAAIAIGVYIVVDAATGGPRDVFFDATVPLDLHRLPKGLLPADSQSTRMLIEHPSASEQRLGLASDLLPIVLAAAILWFMRGVARSVRDGDPFVAANVRRLRAVGALLLAGALVVHYGAIALQDAIADPYLSSPFQPVREQGILPADPDFPLTPLLCGLGAFVIAQVFAHGVELRKDVDATI